MCAASDLDWMGWCVIATVAVALIIMGGDWVGPDIIFTVVLAFFMAAGILNVTTTANRNYGNTGLLTVIKLYLVAEGIFQTGGMEAIMATILGRSRSPFWALVRMMLPTMFLSAFLNNTPVVALFTPILISWSRRTGVPVKKLLIPLSYASVLGGTCTLIGTSTNLVIAGAQASRYQKSDPSAVKFGIFDIAPYGVPYALWGFLFVLAVQRWLLPGNRSKYATNIRMAVRTGRQSPVIGKTIADAGLSKVHETPLVAVFTKGILTRGREISPLHVVKDTDIFYFAGEVDNILVAAEELDLNIINNEHESGLSSIADSLVNPAINKLFKLIEVTVRPESSLVGRSVHDARLRETFDVALVGLQRGHGREHDDRFNDIVIKAGDILLFDAGPSTNISDKLFESHFTNINTVIDSQANHFITSYRVTSNQVGSKTVSDAGLRGMPGIHVLAVDQHGDPSQRLEPVDHHYVLKINDVIWIAADLSGITFLSKYPGLGLTTQYHVDRNGVNILDQELTQVAISANSPLVGRSVVDVKFRQKYRAAVIAYQREGHVSPVDIRHLVLQPGDILLINANKTFAADYKTDKSFMLLLPVANSAPPKKNRAFIAIFLGIAMVLTQIIPGVRNEAEWINLWPGASLTAGAMLFFGCMSGDQARKSILWDVYLTIAAAFGVSDAMQNTGVANEFAQVFIRIANKVGTEGAGLTAVYVATALLSEILTNNAAGAIMYPIAAIAGDQLKISPRSMSVAVMLGGSAGFINPFSYQCNLMVYVAGNYKTLEFAKIGAPFQVYLLVVAAFILHLTDSWHQVWIFSWCVTAGVIGIAAIWTYAIPARITEPLEDKVLLRIENGLKTMFKRNNLQRRDSGDLNVASRTSSSDEGRNGKK